MLISGPSAVRRWCAGCLARLDGAETFLPSDGEVWASVPGLWVRVVNAAGRRGWPVLFPANRSVPQGQRAGEKILRNQKNERKIAKNGKQI